MPILRSICGVAALVLPLLTCDSYVVTAAAETSLGTIILP